MSGLGWFIVGVGRESGERRRPEWREATPRSSGYCRRRSAPCLPGKANLSHFFSKVDCPEAVRRRVKIGLVNIYSCTLLALDPSAILRRPADARPIRGSDVSVAPDGRFCSIARRQSGKSTTVSALALHTALFTPGGLVLLLSPSLRQSGEIFRKVLRWPTPCSDRSLTARSRETQLRLELGNGSRIVCLPGREETIRSFSGVTPAGAGRGGAHSGRPVSRGAADAGGVAWPARRPLDAVRPTRLVLRGMARQRPVEARAGHLERLSADHAGVHRRRDAGAGRTGWPRSTNAASRAAKVWSIRISTRRLWTRIGLRPAAAAACRRHRLRLAQPVRGTLGRARRDDVLWIDGRALPRRNAVARTRGGTGAAPGIGAGAVWYADPAGRTEIEELRVAGLTVRRRGDNDIRLGIAAVTARAANRPAEGPRPVLSESAGGSAARTAIRRPPRRLTSRRTPIDDHNHALGACAI